MAYRSAKLVLEELTRIADLTKRFDSKWLKNIRLCKGGIFIVFCLFAAISDAPPAWSNKRVRHIGISKRM
jgi:hypothetical protein